MHTKHRIGHLLIVMGVFTWLALALTVNYVPGRALAVSSGDVLSLSNSQRTANGLTALTANGSLNAAAQAKANHMRDQSYFAHTAPNGTTGWSFIAAQGYSYSKAGENLASSNQGASSVVTGWMNSPGHRANLLSSTYTEVGHGVAFVGTWVYEGVTYSDTHFVVALYATPTAPSPPPAPDPEPEPEAPVQQQQTTPTPQNNNSQQQQPAAEPEIAETDPIESTPLPAEEPANNQQGEPKEVAVAPIASVAAGEDTLIPPRLAIALASLGLTVIAIGIYLEIRWVRMHGHIQHIHFPHS